MRTVSPGGGEADLLIAPDAEEHLPAASGPLDRGGG